MFQGREGVHVYVDEKPRSADPSTRANRADGRPAREAVLRGWSRGAYPRKRRKDAVHPAEIEDRAQKSPQGKSGVE